MAIDKRIRSLIDSIEKRIDGLEEGMFWLIRPDQRFKVGQRVQFSAIADRRMISARTKGGVRTGKVVKVERAVSIVVLLDGYRTPRSYHHMFFEPTKRRRPRR